MQGKKIYERLKEARINASLTQSQLAKELGCTEGYIAHIETGRSVPSETKLLQLCDLLGLDKREMLTLRQFEKANELALPYYETKDKSTVDVGTAGLTREQLDYALKVLKAVEENEKVKTAIDLIIGED